MQAKPIYQHIASALVAIGNCRRNGNTEWEERHRERIEKMVREHLPSGGGFDSGTSFDEDSSSADRLVFDTSFHHMHESGMYDGWTDHQVVVKPSLAFGFTLRITGKDRNGIKEYLADCFDLSLRTIIEMRAIIED
jgi:hypothetical protein